ncbi:MAG: cobalamin-binding protein [Desulfobulbaceae bacterium]|jgi:iron complex transport system substrate-binding protein|nr:cobalamin-binding protein [Desulfobulbaceae bacterium]
MPFTRTPHLLLPLLITVTLLFQSTPCHARQLVDQAGRTVDVPTHPQRVIALAPSIVEVVYALERQDRLKGATLYSDEPAAARHLPRIGSYVNPDIEKIVALQPDLCLAIMDGNPQAAVSRLESLGIPVYVVNPRSIKGVIAMIIGLGEVLEAPEAARQIAADMQFRLDRVRTRLAATTIRPAVFFQIDAAPIVSAGLGTFIDELITLAGGVNLVAQDGTTGYPKYGWEDILHFQPEVVIVASMAGGHSDAELTAGWRRWPQLHAVQQERLHVLPADLIDRPTPRLIDGLEAFAALIHPELFHGKADS